MRVTVVTLEAAPEAGKGLPVVGRVVVVGLGNLGLALAQRAADAASIIGVDLAPQARAALASTPQASPVAGLAAVNDWSRVERVHVVVRTTTQAEMVMTELLSLSGWTGALHLHTTLAPEFAAGLGRYGTGAVRVLEQPITGGAVGVRSGRFTVLSAGAATPDDRQWLVTLGAAVLEFDRFGLPASAKLVNNAVAAYHTATVSAHLKLASSLGIEPGTMHEVLRAGSGSSWMGDHIADLGDDQAELLAKDLRLLGRVADRLPVIDPLDDPDFVRHVADARAAVAGSPRGGTP